MRVDKKILNFLVITVLSFITFLLKFATVTITFLMYAYYYYINKSGVPKTSSLIIYGVGMKLEDEFSIAQIKDNKEKVYEEIKKVINKRSAELSKLVDRVSFFKDCDPKKEQELLNIILSAKA